MSKIYFEMGKDERVFRHVSHDLDFAITELSEGVESTIHNDKELDKAYNLLLEHLTYAENCVSRILKAFKEE